MTYKFASMLGPQEEYRPGTPEWAERASNRLQIATRSVTKHTAHHLRKQLDLIFDAKPWEYWPKGRPFKTPESYCVNVTGYSWNVLIDTVADLLKDQSFGRKMRADNARAQAETRTQGTRTDIHHVNHMKLRQGTGQVAYTLRRIAKERPDVLARYEAGEFKSVRAAALAAGIIKKSPVSERIKQILRQLTDAELKLLGLQRLHHARVRSPKVTANT
jgi:hypothetical protein